LSNTTLEKAQEASRELGITQEKGNKILEQVRKELLDAGDKLALEFAKTNNIKWSYPIDFLKRIE